MSVVSIKKLWVNFILENMYELQRFKIYIVYLKVKLLWIYTIISFFKTFFPLPLYVLKYLGYVW